MNRRTFIGVATAAMTAAVQKTAAKKLVLSSTTGTGLHIRFLGTGAADWQGVDGRGEHRRFSSILVDNSFLIDYTAQAKDMLPSGVAPTVILYTHSHGDHFNPTDALRLGIKTVYCHSSWYDTCVSRFQSVASTLGVSMPQVLKTTFGVPIEQSNVTVTPLPANHATGNIQEQTQFFLLEKGDVRLIYATDTSGIPVRAARWAGIDPENAGTPITALIMESTMGMNYEVNFRLFTHSSVALVKRTYDVLNSRKLYLPPSGQPVYLTHLARTLHGTQAQLDTQLPSPLKAAYDGLEVDFKPNPAIRD